MVNVTIIYPTDPLGEIPGGTDTCIRDILRFSPDDISIKLVGVSTDPVARPVDTLTRCSLGKSEFDFFPVRSYVSLNKQMRIPLTFHFTLSLINRKVSIGADVLQFHRIEPAFLYFCCNAPKVFFIHQNMNVLKDKSSDIRWKYLPQAYFALENIAMPKAARTYVVREDGVKDYQKRYPRIANRFHFLPTWMNPDLFFSIPDKKRERMKAEFTNGCGWNRDDILFISVGRIDQQKNPLLLIDAFEHLRTRIPQSRLIMVGDGVLRSEIEKQIAERNLLNTVSILGVLGQQEVVKLLRVSDAMVLSSAYEGMPRCVVEALACGLPVVSTNVGEVPRIVHDGDNGFVVPNHRPDSLADAMEKIAHNRSAYAGLPCRNAVKEYTAPVILENVYETYRLLAA